MNLLIFIFLILVSSPAKAETLKSLYDDYVKTSECEDVLSKKKSTFSHSIDRRYQSADTKKKDLLASVRSLLELNSKDPNTLSAEDIDFFRSHYQFASEGYFKSYQSEDEKNKLKDISLLFENCITQFIKIHFNRILQSETAQSSIEEFKKFLDIPNAFHKMIELFEFENLPTEQQTEFWRLILTQVLKKEPISARLVNDYREELLANPASINDPFFNLNNPNEHKHYPQLIRDYGILALTPPQLAQFFISVAYYYDAHFAAEQNDYGEQLRSRIMRALDF